MNKRTKVWSVANGLRSYSDERQDSKIEITSSSRLIYIEPCLHAYQVPCPLSSALRG